MANLKHPNLCIPTDFFYVTPSKELSFTPIPGSTCIGTIMPYIKGDRLENKYQAIADNPKQLLLNWGQMTEGLYVLKKKNLSHNDFNSGNVMIDEEGNAAIIDFDSCGVATALDRGDYEFLRSRISTLISISSAINPGAQKFLLSCLNRAKPGQLASLTFMQNCLDHLEEIQKTPISKL